MPSWGELIKNFDNKDFTVDDLDKLKKSYVSELTKLTGRNAIFYYSAYHQKPNLADVSILDTDVNAFMENLYKLDKKKGLDLILHTPGGDIATTEHIINYISSLFDGDVRAIVPQMAMSAGAMIAVSCKEIVMGKQSYLGPFDPQLGGVPCQSALREFSEAVEDVKNNPSSLGLWQTIISKYNPTFLHTCKQAVTLSEEIAKKNLKKTVDESHIQKVLTLFSDNLDSKTHHRHINIHQCKEAGLKVISLESDPTLQDLILSIHHCYMILFDKTIAVKIVENNIGGFYMRSFNPIPPPPPPVIPPSSLA